MSINNDNPPNQLSSSATNYHDNLEACESRSAPGNKSVVIGVYGLPGSGKTFLLDLLKQELTDSQFVFYEGSHMISEVVPGGLKAFQELAEPEKLHWRQLAIETIKSECEQRGQVAVVAGHVTFWSEGDEVGKSVYTTSDLSTYTHIVYLNVPAETIAKRCEHDTERVRQNASVKHLHDWQIYEITLLRRLCRDNGILFSLINSDPLSMKRFLTLIRDFDIHTEEYNLTLAKSKLDKIFESQSHFETVLVLDADRTLTSEDTGMLFWEKLPNAVTPRDVCPLRTLFSSPMGYSYTAFRQATLLYEEATNDQEFDAICQEVASEVTIYPEFVSLLRQVADSRHVTAMVLSCGLLRVWEKILEREGLSQTVSIIGGGRLADGLIVTPAVKAALVSRLQNTYGKYVWAFGDSPLDIQMMSTADQAIVVVGDEQTRSKTMDIVLLDAIEKHAFKARQVLLPSNVSPRLDTNKLPLIQLTDFRFIESIFSYHGHHVFHATHKNSAKLLMTPMRDARLDGPALREAHRRVGWYLANEFVVDIVGLDEYPILHVQGHYTTGHRLLYEQHTLIVALMRGGEPMAFGVNDAFPLAMFLHASRPENITFQHLQGQQIVILVDSVVNSGKSVMDFVQHIYSINATIRIVIVAGVVQAQCISSGYISDALTRYKNLSLAALRLSDNKFTGKGTTDTGNRLFNTTHLP